MSPTGRVDDREARAVTEVAASACVHNSVCVCVCVRATARVCVSVSVLVHVCEMCE